MGIMVWSPLASGLLSGKYKPSEGGYTGAGRLETLKGASNPAFQKFTNRNWQIVAETVGDKPNGYAPNISIASTGANEKRSLRVDHRSKIEQ
jgi:hypothetical protein